MANHPKHDIFLSHSGQQKGFARDLCNRLSSLNYNVFFDQNYDSLPLGEAFPPLIFTAADTCKLALVVISDDFITSKWPMIELCRLADRLSSQSNNDVPASPFTILPLFFKLTPANIKEKENVERWKKVWEMFEADDHRISAAKCEEAVTKVLLRLNGVVRRHESQQGEASYIEDIVEGILIILRAENFVRCRFGIDPYKKFVGVERLCKVILDEYRDGERNSMDPCILGMYGVPGSGKSTICDFLLESMFDDFSGKVVRLELSTVVMGTYEARVNVKEQYRKFLSMFMPYGKDFSSMDLDEMHRQLLGARFNHKMFLVFDNISPSNYESYKRMVHAILSSASLGSGSRVMLVAQTKEVLENLLGEVNHIYRYTIIEMPSLTKEEATELIRHWYRSADEDVLACLLRKCSFQHSSFMYVPFVFEQIGVLLRDKRCNDVNELELLWKMVGECKKNAIEKLLEIKLKQLPKDLHVLFLDIVLFIIPAGYSKLRDATPILCNMHSIDIADSFKLSWKIMDLQKHCALSVIHKELRVHDIFTEYVRSVPENSRSYVNELVFLPVTDTAMQQYGQHRAHSVYKRKLHLKEARTIHIIVCKCNKSRHDHNAYPLVSDEEEEEISSYHQEMRLDVEVGATTQALIVQNSCRWCKCTVGLSGNLSCLVCFRMENVRQIVFSLESGTDVNLSRLARLELKNESITRDTWKMRTWRGQRMSQLLDFIGSRFQNTTESMMWILKPVLPYARREQWPANYDRLLSNFVLSGRMRDLRVLILENAGIRRLEYVDGCCPQLEVLEIADDEQDEMDITVANAPNLKRLVAGEDRWLYERCVYLGAYDHWFRLKKIRPGNSRKLALRIGGCPELQEVYVDGSFDEMQIVGSLPSSLRHVHMGNGSRPQFMPANLISSSIHQLSMLETLRLSCKKLERLNLKTQCSVAGLPRLKELIVESCDNLIHLSMEPGYIPNLVQLSVVCCDKLEVFEGVQDTLSMEQLNVWRLAELPRLQAQFDVGQGEITRSSLQLEEIHVSECPGVRVHLNFGSMISVTLEEVSIMEEVERCEDNDIDEKAEILRKSDKCSNGDENQVLSMPLTRAPLDHYHHHHRLTFWEGRFTCLRELWLTRVPHLREIEGFQNLPNLLQLWLSYLPDLARLSGAWPSLITILSFDGCPMLQEIPPLEQTPLLQRLLCTRCRKLKSVEGRFGQIKLWSTIRFVECESMEAFPMEGVMEELVKRRTEKIWGWNTLRVEGSKFASVEVMQTWLRDAEWGSHLWAAAVLNLQREHAEKGNMGATNSLRDYFSTVANSTTEEDVLCLNCVASVALLQLLPYSMQCLFKKNLSIRRRTDL